MEFNARTVYLEDVFSVRRCGMSFYFMLELAENLSAMCHVAGLWINFFLLRAFNFISPSFLSRLPLFKGCTIDSPK